MKSRFLDTRNCHALLPKGHGMPMGQRLEECLRQINDKHEKYRGLIDKLIEHNIKTLNKSCGSERYCDSPIEIAQGLNIGSRTINTQAIERPQKGPAKLHIIMEYENGTTWKAIVPLQFLLKGWGDANSGYQCYVHTIAHNMLRVGTFDQLQARQGTDKDDYYYVGITGRNWLHRLSEHLGEIRRGSRRRFYQAWRDSLGIKDVLFVSALMDINMTYEDAMNWEERNVDKVAYGPNGLNMIPGGFKGAKFLHEHRVTDRVGITLEERERAIDKYVRQNPRKGIPNPFISELWEDDDFYLRVIKARPKTLSPLQVRQIRALAEKGWSVSGITKEINALNETQVKNVLAGKTYQRIH
ncbi:MAG: hypothetical protein GY816_18450 [Cytophagales bacterium]|nr:hypothetical protein [Cytophagales bacterium]